MKLWKSSMLIVGIAVLLLSSLTVSAETESDPQGDVWHYIFPYYQSSTVSDQPNSDIQEISAEISGDQITLSMTLWPGGTFTRGSYEYATYIMYYNTSDAWYMLTYSDLTGEELGGTAMGYSLAEYTPPYSIGEVVVNGNTISATMDKVGTDTTTTELYGLSWIWEGYGAEQSNLDHWHDWVGDYDWSPDLDPGDGNGDVTCWQCNENNESVSQTFPAGSVCGESDAEDYPYATEPNCANGGAPPTPKTPGFETLAVIAAIGAALIILRRRK